MASPENVLVNILNDFATFLGEKDKATFEELKTKIENLHQTVMGGEVDEELDTIREIVAELKNLKMLKVTLLKQSCLSSLNSKLKFKL